MKKIITAISMVAMLSASASMAVASAGEDVFNKKCKACHSTTDKKKMGPGLGGVFGRTSDVAGKMDEAGLKAWLKDPKAVNPKAKMPATKLKDQQIADVIEYLKTL